MIRSLLLTAVLICMTMTGHSWGFFGHRLINQHAVFLLPPEMMVLYKPHLAYIFEHAVDPDKRRYAVAEEGPRHFIDIDFYGSYPFSELPRKYEDAVAKYGEETILNNGIVPWYIQTMLGKLTHAFKVRNFALILKYSSDIGHYIADAHVPLHATSNYNGLETDQKGFHGFWESRIPELFAHTEYDFFIGKAEYLKNPTGFMWDRVLESSLAADSVLKFEKILNDKYGANKYAYEPRNNVVIRQYSTAYSAEFSQMLGGMVERRMRESIFAVASFWYTAWVNAGQPDLKDLSRQTLSEEDLKEFEELDKAWRAGKFTGREHED